MDQDVKGGVYKQSHRRQEFGGSGSMVTAELCPTLISLTTRGIQKGNASDKNEPLVFELFELSAPLSFLITYVLSSTAPTSKNNCPVEGSV